MFSIYRVNGNSMLPEIGSGDYVFCMKRRKSLEIGRNVVLRHRHYGTIVKRIKKIDPRGYLWLSGISPESISGKQMGWVAPSQVLGCVLYTIKQ